jgi:hypothetical protein
MLPVCAPTVPQVRIGWPDLPSPMPPHPCVRVAVHERQLIPRPHPLGHQVKTRGRPLGREPVPARQHPRWRAPSTRRKHQARVRRDPSAPSGFGSRYRPSAGWCELRNPARTTRPSHVPMMPLHRCRRSDARRSRAGPLPIKALLTCRLRFQRLPSSVVDRRPRTSWRRPGRAVSGDHHESNHHLVTVLVDASSLP